MGHWFRDGMFTDVMFKNVILPITAGIGVAAVVFVANFSAAQAQVQAQAPYRASRAPDGHPDVSGIWQALNEANWDIQAHAAQAGPPEYGAMFAEPAGVGIVEGDVIPYQPWALAKKKENYENRFKRMRLDG